MSPRIENQMPVLSAPLLNSFVSDILERKQVFLDAADAFGSPLYILEENILNERARQFKSVWTRKLPEAEFYFAMKSNNLPYVSQVLLKNGFGLDVSSGLELETALGLGAERILFSGPGKTNSELEQAVDLNGSVTILVDSLGELRRLSLLAESRKKIVNIGLRLNNNPEGLWRKFGIPIEILDDVYAEILRFSHLRFAGLQCHSSWNLDPLRQVQFIQRLGETLKTMPAKFCDQLKFLDIGGGYWPQMGEWLISEDPLVHHCLPACSIDRFAEDISQALKENIFPLSGCKIYMEPGRWICNDAMHILMSVVDCKSDGLVITDAGTNTIGWERYETDYFPVINLTQSLLEERPCHILGSLCTPHDIWGYAYFGKGLSEGDILMIPFQGAYTYSLRQQFIKPLPKTIVVGGLRSPLCLT